LSLFCCR